jgi:hypothetical protein
VGFFDENPELAGTGGGNYVGEEQKNALKDGGVPFAITKVVREADPFNKPQPGQPQPERHVLTVLIPDEETGEETEMSMAFNIGKVESRNRMLDGMATWLENPANEPPVVKLEKVGRSWVLRPAE